MTTRPMPPRRSPEDIDEAAVALVEGRMVTMYDLVDDPVAATVVFFPLTTSDVLSEYTEDQLADLVFFGIIGKHLTMSRGINGWPVFAECELWLREDFERTVYLAERIWLKMQQARAEDAARE